MLIFWHGLKLVVREPGRSGATAVGVGLAAALTTSILLFGSASGATVTARALATLPVDAQVEIAPQANASSVIRAVRADPAVRTAIAFDLVHFVSAGTTRSGTATQAGSGVLIGYDAAYPTATGLFGLSSGRTTPGAIAISRDFASNLGVVPGDVIRFTLVGGYELQLTVSGIADITGADLILGPVDAAHRAAGANPPTNVAVLDRATLDSVVLPRVPAGAFAVDQSTSPSPGSSSGGGQSPVFVPEPAVRRELHLRFDHSQMPGDPVAAQQWLDAVRRRLEREGAGAFTVVDDAGATLEPLASDLAWGQVLFVFLALPGIGIAVALSQLAADATANATRRHAALLRARGASQRQLYALSLTITAVGALLGGAAGSTIGVFASFGLFGRELAATNPGFSVLLAVLVSVLATTLLAIGAAAIPLRDQLREEVSSGRQELRRPERPWWQRLNLDLLALLAAAAIYVLAGSAGVHPVLSAEGNPTTTLALTAFLAPLLLWLGGTLFLLRLAQRAMARGRRIARPLGAWFGPGGELSAYTLTARAGAAARAITVLALAVSFVTSVLVFDATYRQQQRVDAELTLGADLKATPSISTGANAASALTGPGIAATTPFVDRVVYVGSEAQDLLAVDPMTLPSVASLSDTFFDRLSAKAAIEALKSRPDAILVSAETARDYSLVSGDRVRIRVPDGAGVLRMVDFSMAGVALEFPTAPKDAFLVANLSYVRAKTGNDRISWVLARADGDPISASQGLSTRLGSAWQVTDIGHTTARLANSVTSVDLGDLVVIDVAFGVLISAVGVALFLLAGISERKREIATLEAIGAEPGQIRAALAGEALVIGVAGICVGLFIGLLVAFTLLQILSGIFDPPPNVPAIPFGSLLGVGLAVSVGLVLSTGLADRVVSRLRILSELRER